MANGEASETSERVAWSWRRDLVVGGLLAGLGPLITLREMVGSGFARIPGNAYDGRLVAFLLEHSWLWLRRDPLHRTLWGLPVFWPGGDNALAFSDAMVAYGPLYWPFRAAGIAPDTSFQLWLLATLAASGAAGYALLRCLGVPPVVAFLAGWVTVFSASRIHQISHPQLVPFFYVLFGLIAAVLYARLEGRGRRWSAAACVVSAVVAQLYAGFYYGLFLAVVLAVMMSLALVLRDLRVVLLPRLREDWPALTLLAVLAALALGPWLVHYRAASELVGGRSWQEIRDWVPEPLSWAYVTPRALAYRWIGESSIPTRVADSFEHAVSLGWFTTAAAVVAAVARRRDPRVRIAAGTALVLVLATTSVGRDWELWRAIVTLAPALASARALVRVGLLLPIAAGVCLASWAAASSGRRRGWLLLVLAVAAAEQLSGLQTRDKQVQRRWEELLAARIDRGADAFYVARSARRPSATMIHVDAMWASTLAGVPTLNGHSGIVPPAWDPLASGRHESPEALRAAVTDWLRANGRPGARVQVITLPRGYRLGRRARVDMGELPP